MYGTIFNEFLVVKNVFITTVRLSTHIDIFEEKDVPFWRPYRPSKKFSCAPRNLSQQDASFKYDYIWSDNFSNKKSGNIGRNSKFCQNNFNHLILH